MPAPPDPSRLIEMPPDPSRLVPVDDLEAGGALDPATSSGKPIRSMPDAWGDFKEHLPEAGAFVASLPFGGGGSALSRIGSAVIPPFLGGAAGKAAQNTLNDKSISEGVGTAGLEQAAWSVPLALVGEGGKLVAKRLASGAKNARAIQAGKLVNLSPEATAALEAAEKEHKWVLSETEKATKVAQEGVDKITGKIDKSIASKGKKVDPTQFGALVGGVAGKAKKVARAIERDTYRDVFSQLGPVDISDYADDIINTVDVNQIQSPSLKRAVVDLKKGLAQIEGLHPSVQAAAKQQVIGNTLGNLPFEQAHELKSILGSQGATPVGSLANRSQGATQFLTKNYGDFLKDAATKQGQGGEYVAALGRSANIHELFGKGSMGQALAKVQKLDPQDALKVIGGKKGGVKRINDFKAIVNILNDPKAAQHVKPHELAEAKEAVDTFARLYLEGLNEGGPRQLVKRIEQEGLGTVGTVLQGVTKSKTPLKNPAQTAKANATTLYKLAKQASDALDELENVKSMSKEAVDLSEDNVSKLRKAGEKAGKKELDRSYGANRIGIDVLSVVITSAAAQHFTGIPLPIAPFFMRKVVYDATAFMSKRPELLDGLSKSIEFSTRDRTNKLRGAHLLYSAVKFYMDSEEFESELEKYNADHTGAKEADKIIGLHMEGQRLTPDQIQHLKEHRDSLKFSGPPEPPPVPYANPNQDELDLE